MIYAFVNRPDVRADIIKATNYYKHIKPELAKQFLFVFEKQKSILLEHH